MRAFYSDHFVLPLPQGHRFPMEKYTLLRERVAALGEDDLLVPGAATDAELRRVHDAGYVHRVARGGLTRDEVRRIGFPWSPALVERSRRSVGGTVAAARAALVDGVAANLSGGTHHAFPDRGEGFCVFNDIAVAARAVQAEVEGRRVVILDLDVHQGNGTAAIFREDDSVFTLSVHGANNFPFRKERSDLDVELPDGSGDDEFLEGVERGVSVALANGADLAFYVAGADPYEGDRLGRLAVTKKGLAERDRVVFDLCAEAGAPVAVVMSGGYARNVEDTVDIHFTTIRTASRWATPREVA
ncbi:MAG: histone deacetylase [Gemmatimonadetes bacterium]|nr:histone deacetylase [Gemmatimonadota bacterium]